MFWNQEKKKKKKERERERAGEKENKFYTVSCYWFLFCYENIAKNVVDITFLIINFTQ